MKLTKIVIVLALLTNGSRSMLLAQTINKNWQFRQVGKTEWYPAQVPGCVHTDLLDKKLIPDPYYRDNEKFVQWIESEDWEYKTSFDIPQSTFAKSHIELIFNGLDTYADVYLNNKLILQANNMYRSWSIDCKNNLKVKDNVLRILFHSAVNEGLRKVALNSYILPNHTEKTVLSKKSGSQSRKSPHQFGWDTHPRLVTSGIWRPIVLNAWSEAKMVDNFFDPIKISAQNAQYLIKSNIISDKQKKYVLSVYLDDFKNPAHQQTVLLKKGTNIQNLKFNIRNPKLWWPNGMGKPNLYTIRVSLSDKARIVDEQTTKIGVRTIELIREKDSIGKSFYFRVNGKPMFIKGSNHVPADALVTNVTNQQINSLVTTAKDANLNLLRVWGGAVYENDLFYDLCAEKGLLVWQDFMYACAMYPGDAEFLENIKQETIENVKRLRNNPALALWCGNNELISGWFEWGWPNKPELNISKTDSAKIYNDYKKIFNDIIPAVIKQYNPKTSYWQSSPSSEPDIKSSLTSGDYHYYDVWYNAKSIQSYKTAIPRFMSEYGVQSFPSYFTIKQVLASEDENIFSPVMMSRQKSDMPWLKMDGNKMLMRYLNEDYKTPKDFESLVYMSQLFQADAIKIASEAHRINKPRCMGSVFWQFGDGWPNIGWSVIDYLGKKKAAFYVTKKAFKNLSVIPSLTDTLIGSNTKLNIFINSDSTKSFEGTLLIKLLNFDGESFVEKEMKVRVNALSNAIFYTTPVEEMLKGKNKDELVLSTVLNVNGLKVSENLLYFNHPKFLQLKQPSIKTTIVQQADGFAIQLQTNTLAKSVYLSLPNGDDNFSDNFFDLLPNEKVQIKLNSKLSLKELKQQLSVRSLFESQL